MEELINEINEIIKSNSHKNNYTKNEWCSIEREDLEKLNHLLGKAQKAAIST